MAESVSKGPFGVLLGAWIAGAVRPGIGAVFRGSGWSLGGRVWRQRAVSGLLAALTKPFHHKLTAHHVVFCASSSRLETRTKESYCTGSCSVTNRRAE